MKKSFYAQYKTALFVLPAVVITVAVIIISGCNKKFDAPPLESTDTPTVTMTVKDLKALHARGAYETVSTDGVISGIVTANDSSGNFYQEIVIQDNTGGITVAISASSLYTDFPVGRKVFINVKGLTLGDYGGSIQLGGGVYTNPSTQSKRVDGIASSLVAQYITKGSFNNIVVPVSISDLSVIDTSMQSPLSSALVTLDSLEFAAQDTLSTYGYADKTDSASRWFYLENCAGQQVELYNSSYAYFASLSVPRGKGNITGIYTKFNTTKELLIRDTSDVKFYGPRCGSTGTVTGDTASIADIRKIGNGTIPNGTIIKGIVISDSKNEASGNMRIESEDGSAGVILYFAKGANSSFTMGQEIAVSAGGLTIAPYMGDLEINGVQTAVVIGSGAPVPRTATIADITKNFASWASTLVTVKNITVKHGTASTAGETDTISDGTGTLTTFIRTASNIALPDNASSITGYVSVYQKSGADAVAQLGLRDQNDVAGGGDNPPPVTGTDFNAVYDFANVTSSSGSTDPTEAPAADGITFGSFKAVNVSDNSSGAGRFSFSGWPIGAANGSDDFTGSIDATKYYEVTITPASGKTVSLSGLTFTLQRSGTGIRQAAVRSSLDNYAADIPAAIDPANANLSVVGSDIIQVSDAATTAQDGSTITLGTAFSSISAPVTFRFYGFNAEATGGTFSIDNVTFSGSVK